ncbi:MAG: serine acetyltransferase [Oligoflexia bacterium]|nr:serine acetyltransferase [Oligoflexia bacterium]
MIKKDKLYNVVSTLCSEESYSEVAFRNRFDKQMPSVEELGKAVELLRSVLFPGYFGSADFTPVNQHYFIGSNLNKVVEILNEQIKRGYCFICPEDKKDCDKCDKKSKDIVEQFLEILPSLRHLLVTDAIAAYEGDPAAHSPSEAVFCYPSLRAMINHRIAHELYKLAVPLIPRIISECAHSETGIDIHPGAQIGESFFMDHGTGIVIGETSVIGKNVRLYQGVTLGAKSFPLDSDGNPIKGVPRHPLIEDDVIIYSGATILGRITIGKGSVIGGNVWLTESVPPDTRVILGEKCIIRKPEGE